jgi:hypothetical protein
MIVTSDWVLTPSISDRSSTTVEERFHRVSLIPTSPSCYHKTRYGGQPDLITRNPTANFIYGGCRKGERVLAIELSSGINARLYLCGRTITIRNEPLKYLIEPKDYTSAYLPNSCPQNLNLSFETFATIQICHFSLWRRCSSFSSWSQQEVTALPPPSLLADKA